MTTIQLVCIGFFSIGMPTLPLLLFISYRESITFFSLMLLLFWSRFFRLLLQLVANESIEESYDKVEDHQKDAPVPYFLNQWFLFRIKLFLCLEKCLFLLLYCLTYARCGTRSKILHEVENWIHNMLRESYYYENDLDRDFVNCLSNQSWDKEGHEGQLEVAAHKPCQVEKWVRNLHQTKNQRLKTEKKN